MISYGLLISDSDFKWPDFEFNMRLNKQLVIHATWFHQMELAEHDCLAAGVKSSWPACNDDVVIFSNSTFSFLFRFRANMFLDTGKKHSIWHSMWKRVTDWAKSGARVLSWACQAHESSCVITFWSFFFSQRANPMIQMGLRRQERAVWPLVAPEGCHCDFSKQQVFIPENWQIANPGLELPSLSNYSWIGKSFSSIRAGCKPKIISGSDHGGLTYTASCSQLKNLFCGCFAACSFAVV